MHGPAMYILLQHTCQDNQNTRFNQHSRYQKCRKLQPEEGLSDSMNTGPVCFSRSEQKVVICKSRLFGVGCMDGGSFTTSENC